MTEGQSCTVTLRFWWVFIHISLVLSINNCNIKMFCDDLNHLSGTIMQKNCVRHQTVCYSAYVPSALIALCSVVMTRLWNTNQSCKLCDKCAKNGKASTEFSKKLTFAYCTYCITHIILQRCFTGGGHLERIQQGTKWKINEWVIFLFLNKAEVVENFKTVSWSVVVTRKSNMLLLIAHYWLTSLIKKTLPTSFKSVSTFVYFHSQFTYLQ